MLFVITLTFGFPFTDITLYICKMKSFLVDILLPKNFQEDINKMIPTQRKIVNVLMTEGIILSYALSIKKDRLFVVMNQDNENDVMLTVQRFPIYRFIIDYEIVELMFHETVSSDTPQLWLN